MTTFSFNTESPSTQLRHAVAFALLSGFLNSFGGFILRSIGESSEWQIVLFRTGSLSVALLAILLIKSTDSFLVNMKQMDFWGFMAGVLFCCMQTLFIFSLSHTTVANTVFILSSGPIFTTLLAWLVLRETVSRGTWIILTAALLGTALMVGDGLSSGGFFGNLAALFGALSFAGFVVIFRAKRKDDMMPSVVVGGVLASVIAFAGAGGDLSVPAADLVLCLFWGGILSTLVIIFFTIASRHLKGSDLTILLMFEYLLGPFWVWLFIDEVPALATLVGGAIVLSGVVGQAYLSGARARASLPVDPTQ